MQVRAVHRWYAWQGAVALSAVGTLLSFGRAMGLWGLAKVAQ